MTLPFARLARLLDLDRPIPGERTGWTVRTAHGVHTVELEQAITGTQVSVDGVVVARSSSWSFPDQPFRFTVAGSAAILAISYDTARGTERASLLVGGEPIAQDTPDGRTRRSRPIAWGTTLARAGYLLGGVLIVSAAAGDPLFGIVSAVLATAVEVTWFATVRLVDGSGLLPAWIHPVAASRTGALVAGIEMVLLITLARDRGLQRRLPLLRSASRVWRAAGWSVLILAAAILPRFLDG